MSIFLVLHVHYLWLMYRHHKICGSHVQANTLLVAYVPANIYLVVHVQADVSHVHVSYCWLQHLHVGKLLLNSETPQEIGS